MLEELDHWYDSKEEPNRSCLQAMRYWILEFDQDIAEAWKYRMPMFTYKGKMFCYLWLDKKTNLPYLGIVKGEYINHPMLKQEKRKKMKVLDLSPEQDFPLDTISEIFQEAMKHYS